MVTLRSQYKIAGDPQNCHAAARRKPFGFRHSQIDHQHNRRFCQNRRTKNSNTPRLDQPRQRRRASGDQSAILHANQCPIIRDQHRPERHQPQRHRRFSRSGRTKDQNPPPVRRHTTCVQRQGRFWGYHTGRPTTNRAPSGSDVMSASVGRIFSAQITPPCASTICLEIASPRPE